MGTPRKHWFKVADSIGDEDWDNDVLATLIRLQARLNTKWARNGLSGEEAGSITLTAGDAMAVTRRTSFARALQVLRRCTAAVSLVLHEQRASVKLEWPKWPEFQGLTVRELPESRPLRKTPPQDAHSDSDKKKKSDAPPALELVEPEVVNPGWAAVVDAMAAYVPSRARCQSSTKRIAAMTKVAGQFGPSAPVDAIHGYAAMHFGKPASDRFDPETNFTVETIWGGKIAKYLDADRAAQDAGRRRPYNAEPRDSVRDTTLRVFEMIKAERSAKGLH